MEILDLARAKKSRGFCAQYAIVFLQACRSLGLHARYIDIEHFIVGVWSDELNEWILMDPTNDLHYERGRRVLGGRELSAAAWSGRFRGIEKVLGDGSRKAVSSEDLEEFKKYSVCLENDQLTRPVRLRVNGEEMVLTHQDDPSRYPVLGREQIGYGNYCVTWRGSGGKNMWPGRPASSDPDDFRDVYNQTIIVPVARNARRGVLKMRLLSENTPEFAGFAARTDSSDWRGALGEAVWSLRPGMNEFQARVRTRDGWEGPVSTVQAWYLEPARWPFTRGS